VQHRDSRIQNKFGPGDVSKISIELRFKGKHTLEQTLKIPMYLQERCLNRFKGGKADPILAKALTKMTSVRSDYYDFKVL